MVAGSLAMGVTEVSRGRSVLPIAVRGLTGALLALAAVDVEADIIIAAAADDDPSLQHAKSFWEEYTTLPGPQMSSMAPIETLDVTKLGPKS